MIEVRSSAEPEAAASAADRLGQPVSGTAAPSGEDRRILAAVERSRAQWRRLKLRMQSITPSEVARGLLVIGAAVAVLWLLATAWFSLLPFHVGLALAYITLPLVNRLDRVMPRFMAVLLVILLQLGAVVLFIGGLIPPLVEQTTALARTVPGAFDVRELVDRLRDWVGTLPPQQQTFVLDAVNRAVTFVRDNGIVVIERLLNLVILGSFTLLEWVGFSLGFLAIPTFLFAVMSDQRAGARAINRALPTAARADFWAVVRIVDRTLSSYLRGQLLRAAVFGTIVGVGLSLLDEVGFTGARYPVMLGMIAGLMYLVPTIGWLLAAVPAVLLAVTQSRETAIAALALYAGAAVLETNLLAPRVERRSIDVHPAVLMPVLVAFSQFNLLLVILAAPLTVMARDLFRYAYGRLGDPPRPAGLLPGRSREAWEQLRTVPARPAPSPVRARAGPYGVPYPAPLDGGPPTEEVTRHD
jgi:predicted PurR-regulated permease PerM